MSLTVSRCEIDLALDDLEKTKKLITTLMNTPHYQTMGAVGIAAVVQKAKAVGLNPLDALNGGMYFVQGKVEMSGQAMLALIRQKGHSVTIDPKSTQHHVIMTGRRIDNGDEWTVEFGIDDAKRAGIYKATWEKYPKTMCIWRCVSMLGRFLFSDVIRGCYVEGEISQNPSIDEALDAIAIPHEEVKPEIKTITQEQHESLIEAIGDDDECRKKVDKFLGSLKVGLLCQLPSDAYNKTMKAILNHHAAKCKVVEEEEGEMVDE